MFDIIKIDSDNFTNYRLNISKSYSYGSVQDYFCQYKKYLPSLYSYKLDKFLEIPTQDYYQYKKNIKNKSISPSILPVAVRYVSKYGKYVIERPPFQVEVDFRLGTAASGAKKMHPVRIWIPWTITILDTSTPTLESLQKTQIFFNDGPLYSMDDHFIQTYLPNAYSNGNICFSSSMNDYSEVLDSSHLFSNISYLYNYVFNNYMTGGWNCDLTPLILAYISPYSGATPDLKYHQEYISPSLQRKQKALENFKDASSDVYKAAKSSLFSKVHPSSINKYHRLYLRHFAVLSTFNLEETLGFVSDMKQISYNMHQKNKYHKSLYSINNLISSDSSNDVTSSQSSTSIINSILGDPSVSQEYCYSYDSSIGHIIINNPPLRFDSYRNSMRLANIPTLIPQNLIPSLKNIIINLNKDQTQKHQHKSILIDYNAEDPDSSSITLLDSSTQYLSEKFEELLADIPASSIHRDLKRYLPSDNLSNFIKDLM